MSPFVGSVFLKPLDDTFNFTITFEIDGSTLFIGRIELKGRESLDLD